MDYLSSTGDQFLVCRPGAVEEEGPMPGLLPLRMALFDAGKAQGGAEEAPPEAAAVSILEGLVDQSHCGQHLHGHKELFLGQRPLQQRRPGASFFPSQVRPTEAPSRRF